MVDFKIHFLGTSSAVPTKERGLSCTAISYENSLAFFDCGEGSQRAINLAGLGFNKDSTVFITHMHGDHVVGLLGLLQTMSMNRREKRLEIFGPKGIIDFVKTNREILKFGMTFDAVVNEIRPGLIYSNLKYKVYAQRSDHVDESFAYVFEEREKPGKFDTSKASMLGVPEGPLWSTLQHGSKVISPKTGKVVRPEQVLGPTRMGKKIGISGDTRPSSKLQRFFKGCNLLIFDSTYSDTHAANAVENRHSTSREAAKLAKKAGVKKLVLTHFSARYKNVSSLVKQAREVFPATIAARDGLIYDVERES
ncbi:MAG: ribonuclease Z [Nitrososphaerota archaeon]|nr:ribonuclease Z [Nitrososphaerota archaeon]